MEDLRTRLLALCDEWEENRDNPDGRWFPTWDAAARLRAELSKPEPGAALLPSPSALRAVLEQLLWWSEWMQREDWAAAAVADTQVEADRLLDLMDTLESHEKRARWLRAALNPDGRTP